MNNNINDTNDTKIKLFENKLSTYIDIYNIKYNNNESNENIIKYNNIKLERIGNFETIYKNFNNDNKKIADKLSYSIHKQNILLILDKIQYIMSNKDYTFNFIIYNYELYIVNGIDNMYVIKQKNKNVIYKFEDSCIMLIFIRDKLFMHYY
jgi:hypothetical protein